MYKNMKNRRNILKVATLGLFSLVITACTKVMNGSSAPAPVESSTTPEPESTTASPANGAVIAQLTSLKTGEGFNFTANDGTDAILFKTKDEKVYALSRICTHEGCSVDFDFAQNKLICPCHGAEYESGAGNALSGPTQRALKKITVKIEGDNVLEVI
jgi:Rieske Fe-S protein